MEPVKIKYSELDIRKAIRSYWWKQVGSAYLPIFVSLIVILSYQIATDKFNWFIGVVSFGAIICLASMVFLYFEYINRSLNQLRSMQVPEATLELEKEKFRITSDAWVLENMWNSIRDIWHFDNVSILEISRYKFVVLPVIGLTNEAKSIIFSKTESALYHTSQAWKIRAYYASVWVCVFFTICPWLIESFPRQWYTYSYMIGFICWVGALYFKYTIWKNNL